MTDREKLIAILKVPIYPHELADPAEVVADYLLDNGVTFAPRWVPVTERMPEGVDEVMVLDEAGNIFNSCFDDCQDEHKFGSWSGYYDPTTLGFVDGVWVPWEGVTHWMPLPEPPQEE